MTDSVSDLDPELADRIAELADEFRARQARGESPAVEAFVAQYPEVASEVRGVLAMIDLNGPTIAPDLFENGVLGDFRIVREIGRGGMGIVYEAIQISLGRRVALKVLPFATLMDPRMLQRFKNEAQAAAALDHTNVVKVHAVGQERGVHYIAMQFIDGQPLSDLIQRPSEAKLPSAASTLPDSRTSEFFRIAADLTAQGADGLEHAHSMGVTHRDVKPANLLVDPNGMLWVTDFGLAKLASAEANLTMTGDVFGTLRYMSPEQALAKHGLVDARTDVYALGATLYEMITGRPAIDGVDRSEILRAITDADPIPPRRLNRAVPRDLEKVVMKCLHKNPMDRYPSAKELADDLRRFRRGEVVRARPISSFRTATRWARRRPAPLVAGLLALAILIAGPIVAIRHEAFKEVIEEREKSERSAHELAYVREAAALTESIRRENVEHTPGWTTRNKAALRRLTEVEGDHLDRVEFRHDLATTLAGGEWHEVARLMPDALADSGVFSPDGKTLALVGSQVDDNLRGPLILVDVKTWKIEREFVFEGHALEKLPGDARPLLEGARSLAWSPDNRFIYVGLRSGYLTCFDRSAPGHSAVASMRCFDAGGEVKSVYCSNDGKRLVAASPQLRTARSWPLPIKDGGEKSFLEFRANVDPSYFVYHAKLSRFDGRLMFFLSGVGAWSLNENTLEPRNQSSAKRPDWGIDEGNAEVCTDGSEVFVASGIEIWLCDARHDSAAGKQASQFDSRLGKASINCIAIDSNRRHVAAAMENDVIVWDLTSGEIVSQLHPPPFIGTGLSNVRFSSDGRHLVVPHRPTIIYEFRPATIVEPRGMQAMSIHSFAVADQSGDLATSAYGIYRNRGYSSGRLFPPVGPIREFLHESNRVENLAIAPDGTFVSSMMGGRTIISTYLKPIRDAWTRPIVINQSDTQLMAFNRSGQHLWFGQELTLRRSGWNSNRIECQRDVPRNDRGIHQIRAVAAGAKYVLAANRDGCLDLHDEETAEWLRSFEVSKQSLFAVALSRDETLAVTGALDGEVSILTLPDGPEVARLKAHVGQVNSVAISPDNRLLATAGADGRLRLWLKSATTWEPLTDLPTGRKPVRQIHLDAAGEKLYVLLAGERGVRVWDLNELRRAFAEYGVGW